MLSANSNGRCLARTDFSPYHPPLPGSAAPMETPRLLDGLAQGVYRGWSRPTQS